MVTHQCSAMACDANYAPYHATTGFMGWLTNDLDLSEECPAVGNAGAKVSLSRRGLWTSNDANENGGRLVM